MEAVVGGKGHFSRWGALLAAVGLGGCGGSSASAPSSAELPVGFDSQRQLSVEQGECSDNTVGTPLTASVRWSTDGKALQVDSATFRCEQAVCAYLDASDADAELLLQPCDMHPATVTKCVCGYSFRVPIALPSDATRVAVQVRGDSFGGTHEPETIGSVFVGKNAALCDGSSALRFAATNGGGNLNGIPALVAELGWSFLLIDGQCRYYAMTAPDHAIHSATLSDADAASLAGDFQLGAWNGLDRPPSGCSDAPTQGFAFGADRVHSSCETTALTTANDKWLPRLYDAGSPVSGVVRYWVVEPSNEQWPTSSPASALPYPLADPTNIASTPFAPAKPQVALGSGANALRGLRTDYQQRMRSVLAPAYSLPVVVTAGGNGARYFDLAMRDTVPFEVDGVLAVDAFLE